MESLDRGRRRLTNRRHGSPYSGIDRSVDNEKRFQISEQTFVLLISETRAGVARDVNTYYGSRRRQELSVGTIIHDFVCVVGDDVTRQDDEPVDSPLRLAHAIAVRIGLIVTQIVPQVANGDSTFFICPDGSKEGWGISTEYDEKRDAWKAYVALKSNRCRVDWCHVRFGETGDGEAYVDSESHVTKSLQEQFDVLEREMQKMGERAQVLERRLKAGES